MVTAMTEREMICQALSSLRAPLQQGEYDLHQLVMECLAAHGILFEHEARLGPRCRIDLLSGTVGLEIKRGKCDAARIRAQLSRYAACDQLTALVLVTERTISVPRTLAGKPVRMICLNRLWGIAL